MQFKFPTPKEWGSNSPPPGRLWSSNSLLPGTAKVSNARGMPGGGMLKLRFDRYINTKKTNQNLINARKFNKLNLEYMTILWELPVSLQAFSTPNVLIIWSWANMNWKQARNSWTGREIHQLNSLPSSPTLIALGCIPLSLIHSTR